MKVMVFGATGMVGAGVLREALADTSVEAVLSFCYCSAMGAGGRSIWARVRRRVEGELKALPFRHAGCVRPGFIQPGPGIRSHVAATTTDTTPCGLRVRLTRISTSWPSAVRKSISRSAEQVVAHQTSGAAESVVWRFRDAIR